MNKKQSVQTLLILGTVLTIGMIGLPSTNIPLYAGDGYDNDDGHINWKKFKNSDTYEDADKDTKKCFREVHDRGDNLAGYEVESCEEDANSYSDDDKDSDDDDDDDDNKYSNNDDDDDDKDSDDGDDGKDSDDDDDDDDNKSSNNDDNGDDGKDSDDGDDGKDSDDGDDGEDGN